MDGNLNILKQELLHSHEVFKLLEKRFLEDIVNEIIEDRHWELSEQRIDMLMKATNIFEKEIYLFKQYFKEYIYCYQGSNRKVYI